VNGDAFQVERLNILDSAAGARWDDLVRSHGDHTVFHTAAWGRVVCETYGHKPYYLLFISDGDPLALVPLIEIVSPLTGRRGVCLPFSDACGPLVFQDVCLAAVESEMSRAIRDRGWRYIELRGGEYLHSSAAPAATFLGHSLKLSPDMDATFDGFHAGARDAIRQASNQDLTVSILKTDEALRSFYNLHCKTRRRHGVPPQPFRFFARIQNHLISSGRGFIALASVGSRVVAGALFLQEGKKAIYKYAASNPAFSRSRANNLVMWQAIRYLARSGCELLDFGRTSVANEGLRRFKLSWGTIENMISYHRFDDGHHKPVQKTDRETGFHNHVFRNLPLSLNRLAGTVLYPHLD